MNKQGQIYILAAILFGFVLFMLTSRMNYATEKSIEDDFKELSENYAVEASKFVNNLLEKSNADVANSFSRFTVDFAKFARNQNPDFGLIFLFPYKKILYVDNYFDKTIRVKEQTLEGCGGARDVNINTDDINLGGQYYPTDVGDVKDCRMTTSAGDKINIVIEGIKYEFDTNKNVPELVILSREDKEGQIKVFMNNKVVSGEEVA